MVINLEMHVNVDIGMTFQPQIANIMYNKLIESGIKNLTKPNTKFQLSKINDIDLIERALHSIEQTPK